MKNKNQKSFTHHANLSEVHVCMVDLVDDASAVKQGGKVEVQMYSKDSYEENKVLHSK